MMKNVKKIPTKQLEKFSNIFMQLGLVLVLFLVYVLLEHQTAKKALVVIDSFHQQDPIYLLDESTVIFRKEPKVVLKAAIPEQHPVFLEKIIKGDDVIIETVIDIPSKTPILIDIDDVIVVKEDEDFNPEDAVTFPNIQNAPVFKGCEGLSKEDNKVCFDKKMKRFVQRNFDAGLANELGLHAGKYKIKTQFVINKEGNIVDIQINAPHARLKKETNRLIKKLPKFKAGKQNNRAVKVRYTLPISFRVD
jgi:protein TonB